MEVLCPKESARGRRRKLKCTLAFAALKEHESGDAAEILHAVLREISAQSGKHLTAEAVGLLEGNIQYLISQLPKSLGE
jgi:hypothetical protein